MTKPGRSLTRSRKKGKPELTNSLLGWCAEDYRGMDYATLDADPKSGIIGGGATAPPRFAVYVQVDEVERFLAQARNLGATKVLQEPYDIPQVGRFAVFTDPEENRIGLWKVLQK